jgi:hypothetical protein
MESERQFDINKRMAQQDFLSRLMKQRQDYELARDTAERADKGLARQERALSVTAAQNTDVAVRNLIASDIADEQKTIGELGAVGLTPERKQQIKDDRAARRRFVEDSLAAYGKEGIYREIYGDPLGRLAPSRVTASGYEAPINLPVQDRIAIFGNARKAIEQVAPSQKMAAWEGQVRQLQLAGIDRRLIEEHLPMPGRVYQEAPKTMEVPRAAMSGEQFTFITPMAGMPSIPIPITQFRPKETRPSGERITRTILPSGEVQVARQQQPDVTEQYQGPERAELERRLKEVQLREAEALLDPKVRRRLLENEQLRIKNALAEKQLNWYDRLTDAKIKDLLEENRGAARRGAAAAKDAVGELMSVSDAVKVYNAESMNAWRNATLREQWLARRDRTISSLRSRIASARNKAGAARLEESKAKDTAYAAVQRAAGKLATELETEADSLSRQLDAIERGEIGGVDPYQMSSGELSTYLAPGGNRLMDLMQGGVNRTQQGQSGQQGTIFSPVFNVSGPGVQGAVAGQGGAPGAAPGAGASPFGPGGPKPDDLEKPTSGKTLADWKKVFPLLPDGDITRNMDRNGNISAPARMILQKKNEKLKEDASLFYTVTDPDTGITRRISGRRPASPTATPRPSGNTDATVSGTRLPGVSF